MIETIRDLSQTKRVRVHKAAEFFCLAYYQKKKTNKECFLGEMNEVLTWDLMLAPILKHYPKPGNTFEFGMKATWVAIPRAGSTA